jgi:hypothetical protein
MNDRTRQLFIFANLICFPLKLLAEPQLIGSSSAPKEPLSLWYRQPAVKWEEALPVGKGVRQNSSN